MLDISISAAQLYYNFLANLDLAVLFRIQQGLDIYRDFSGGKGRLD